ncbi:MAG TPA: FdtA/QdtA family cupin domain-containing protein [Rhizomicrobium sp.]|nr:FdtA/QdtA family cupin domain-containing protein [Rhizomicrobium sp.]
MAHTLITLPQRKDDRGTLTFGQQHDQLPFFVKRLFLLSDIAPGASRGGHAHRHQHQLLLMTRGASSVTVDDGRTRSLVRLDRPDLALYVPPMLWLDLNEFSPDCACLVLASDLYDEADYIRDYAEFLRLTGPR